MRLMNWIALLAVGAWSHGAMAETGVHGDKVVFGQSAALDGPAAALGQGMQLGIKAAFEEAKRRWRRGRAHARAHERR